MSALDDIRAELKRLAPPQDGRERVIFLGGSAFTSVMVDAVTGASGVKVSKNGVLIDEVEGFAVRKASDYLGWEILDVDPRGRCHKTEAAQ